MTEAKTAVRHFYESFSTGNATLADEVLTPDAKTSRCPRSARTRITERSVSVSAAKHRQRNSIQQIFGRPYAAFRVGSRTVSLVPHLPLARKYPMLLFLVKAFLRSSGN